MENGFITRTALHWTPEGRRISEVGPIIPGDELLRHAEMKALKLGNVTIEKLANDRQRWKIFQLLLPYIPVGINGQ